MLEAGEQLDQALRVGGTQMRARRSRMRWIYATAASYATDTLFLALFAALGTIPAQIAVVYGAATAVVTTSVGPCRAATADSSGVVRTTSPRNAV